MALFNKKRTTIGLIEDITIEDSQNYKAKIDTGADSSSIDEAILKKLDIKEFSKHKIVKSALGKHKRQTVILEVEFKGERFRERFSISDRSNLKYKVLVGKNILKKGNFLIDPNL